jgi:hypothetical protein
MNENGGQPQGALRIPVLAITYDKYVLNFDEFAVELDGTAGLDNIATGEV